MGLLFAHTVKLSVRLLSGGAFLWARLLNSVLLPDLVASRVPCADDIYREDVVFRDPRNSFQGLKNYKTIFWSLRFHGRLFFKVLYVDVQRIWQPEDTQIR